MLAFKKFRRIALASTLLTCGAYVYFVAPSFQPGGLQPGVPAASLLSSHETAESRDTVGLNAGRSAVQPPRSNDDNSSKNQPGSFDKRSSPANINVDVHHQQSQLHQQQQPPLPSSQQLQKKQSYLHQPQLQTQQDRVLSYAQRSKSLVKDEKPSSNGPVEEALIPDRPWFFQHGSKRPLPGERGNLWPHEDPDSDRIVEQLMFMPLNLSGPFKKIYLQRNSWGGIPLGQSVFLRDNCPVNRCTIVNDPETAHAVLFKDRYVPVPGTRHPDQVYILYLLECPMHTPGFRDLGPTFNWTATYRHDSDLVAPYEKWVSYPDITEDSPPNEEPLDSNYEQRTKDVAWFVSNCNARNGRLQYARMLSGFINVDVFGACSKQKCPRYNKSCFEMLDTTYKFYLAFENSNCQDYITEKFFVNGLNHSIVPIVMGARKSEYVRAAPPNSFIHVDDFKSAKELASYLREVGGDRKRWESFLRSRRRGEMINTYFFCRLCAMLHDDIPRKVYPDIHTWWAGPKVCASRTWKPESKAKRHEPAYKFL